MLISASLYDKFLQVQLGAALCLMATLHLERTRSNYTARVVSSNSFLNGSYLILLIIFPPLDWRWEMDRGYIPIYSWSPMAPIELKTLISCNCIVGDCSCFRNNVKCVSWQAITLTLNYLFFLSLFRTFRL